MASLICKRVMLLKSMVGWTPLRGHTALSNGDLLNTSARLSASLRSNQSFHKQISHILKPDWRRSFHVDTLALVKQLEAHGIPSEHAEVITAVIANALEDCWEKVAQSYGLKVEMQLNAMFQDAKFSKFKSEVLNSQEHHVSWSQREIEKLRPNIEKLRIDMRYEIDKVTAGYRLDLNLERGRTQDELANLREETTSLTNKLDKEIHSCRAQLEAAKYDMIKYCIGTIVSVSAVGLAVLRILI
ncbi:protein FMP32, mitochondrial-like isoform X2 [Tasmannia lanceolata]|uniref:protein FMP32, mitochondrial-like isoform X2 n=1 Tax=Tasmannia lanceolata TaxID=3420 RepID=UPI0040634FAF